VTCIAYGIYIDNNEERRVKNEELGMKNEEPKIKTITKTIERRMI